MKFRNIITQKKIKGETTAGLFMLSPYIAGFLALYIVPFFISVAYTFTSGVAFRGNFVGLANYISVFKSAAFQLAVKNTFRFLLVSIPAIILLSFLIANALFKTFKGSKFFRSVFLFPLVVPVGAVVMFMSVFFESNGVLNTLLSFIGLEISESWIFSSRAFPVLVFMYIWKNCGYNIVLFLAGFNYIPKEMYEYAAVSGANKRQTLRYVTIPMMRSSFFFVFIISIVNIFKSFREAYLIGGSIPHESIYMIQHFMSNNFSNLNYQRLSIASFLVFFIIFLLVSLLYRSWKKQEISL